MQIYYTTRILCAAVVAVLMASAIGCSVSAPGGTPPAASAADAKTFLDTVSTTLLKLGVAGSQAGWVAQNFITDDTEALDALIEVAKTARGASIREVALRRIARSDDPKAVLFFEEILLGRK